jgi:predicted MFS family arabinose efflux permease
VDHHHASGSIIGLGAQCVSGVIEESSPFVDDIGVDFAAREAPVPAGSWWLLVFLIAAHTCCWMDRYLVIILNEPMKRDLNLSDSQLGLISGFAFSLIYSLSALPLGRLVDHGPRRLILSAVVAIFSAATMLASFVKGFASLAATRLVVASAESGLSPAAYSLISDSFPIRWRGRAISLYSLGLASGTWAGLMLGGLFNDLVGWRATFLIVGSPGIVVALIALVWMRDPVRGRFDNVAITAQTFTFAEAIRFMSRNRAFVASAAALGLLTITTGAFEGWAPTYLIRDRGMSAGAAGVLSGTMSGVGGAAATLLIGVLADVLGRRDLRWYLWLPLMGVVVLIPSELLFFHTQGAVSYVCYFIAILAGSTYVAPLFALGQVLLPARIRALGAAMMLLVINLIGMGGGMLGTGVISDLLHAHGANDPLGTALQLLTAGAVLGAGALAYASMWADRDLPIRA